MSALKSFHSDRFCHCAEWFTLKPGASQRGRHIRNVSGRGANGGDWGGADRRHCRACFDGTRAVADMVHRPTKKPSVKTAER